jgi:hypothetical protein
VADEVLISEAMVQVVVLVVAQDKALVMAARRILLMVDLVRLDKVIRVVVVETALVGIMFAVRVVVAVLVVAVQEVVVNQMEG